MMGRLFRQLTGHGRREERAAEIMREYEVSSGPEKREIATRAAAVERLVMHLERDAALWNSPSDSSQH